MTKKYKKKQSRVADSEPEVRDAATGENDNDVDHDSEGGNGPMLDSEKTSERPRKKKVHRDKGKGDTPAEDGDFERPRKRHKLRNSSGDASPGYSHMRSRPATAEDSPRSSPVPSSSSSPVSSSPEPEPPTDPQSVLDHRTRTSASPPPPLPLPLPLQRFPLPSRPHAPEKSELASQCLDRALASARLVDPLLSTPLSLEDENGDDITGLSARTLKRLRDLGIVELFAGVLLLCRFRRPDGTY